MDNEIKIIALANQKGGVAKTTCTYNLAAVKAQEGHRVLMIDLDPQASLTISCGIEPGDKEYERNTCDLFNWKVNPAECCYVVEKSGLKNLYIVPSDIDLALTERDLLVGRNSDVQLRKATQKLREYFDYIFIDCPPQLGTLLTNALAAADEVIVPVKTDYLAFRGLKALVETIEGVKSGDGDRSLNPDLKFGGVVATMFQVTANDSRDIQELLRRQYTLLGTIKNTVEVTRRMIDGVPVVVGNSSSEVANSFRVIADRL